MGLKGWVRNRQDVSVEALFSGNDDSVQEVEQGRHRGPQAAIVTGVEVFLCNNDPGYGFVQFGIEPKVEHYPLLVDLMGRYGQLEEAMGLISLIRLCGVHYFMLVGFICM